LAQTCLITTGAVTARLDRLERAGLITRTPDPTDGAKYARHWDRDDRPPRLITGARRRGSSKQSVTAFPSVIGVLLGSSSAPTTPSIGMEARGSWYQAPAGRLCRYMSPENKS
jgi:MarR family